MQDTFARNPGEKLTIGLIVLLAVVALGAIGAWNAITNLGESSYSGVAGDRLDTLAADDAAKNLFPSGTTIRTDRGGSCGGETPPRFVREMSTSESAFAVFAFYGQELPRRGWVQKDTGSDSVPHLVFTKDFEGVAGGNWTGEIEVTGKDLGRGKTGYTVTATATPDGCTID